MIILCNPSTHFAAHMQQFQQDKYLAETSLLILQESLQKQQKAVILRHPFRLTPRL